MTDIAHRLSLVRHFKLRTDIVKLLQKNAIGVELGVAEGKFSESLLKTSCFNHLYSVDMWRGDRGHDVDQYKSALRRLLPFKNQSTVLRMRFDEAADLFPNGYFDFIYIDGYAHTGEEEGETFRQWWPKLKPGGIMAGDDYADSWPMVVKSVDDFIADYGLSMEVLTFEKTSDTWSLFPTWLTIKPANHERLIGTPQLLRANIANAEYQAGTMKLAYTSGRPQDTVATFDITRIDLLPVTTAVDVSNLYLASASVIYKNHALLPSSIGTALKHALQGSAASDATTLVSIDKLAKINSNWYPSLRSDSNLSTQTLEEIVAEQTKPTASQELHTLLIGNPEQHWEWWAVIYARLLRLGHMEAAYHAKEKSARLLTLTKQGTSSQLEAAHFFIENNWPDFIAKKPIPRIFSGTEHINLIKDKKIFLTTSLLHECSDLSATDMTVRLNHLPAPNGPKNHRTEIIYCSMGFYWVNRKNIQTLLGAEQIAAVVTLANGEVDSLYQHKMFRPQAEQPGTFLGFGYAARRAINDLISLGASSISVSGIDFFLSNSPSQDTDVGLSYLLHDPLDMWRCMKAFQSAGALKADEFLSSLLNLEEHAFLHRLGMNVASRFHGKA